jgi:LPS-assembly protein
MPPPPPPPPPAEAPGAAGPKPPQVVRANPVPPGEYRVEAIVQEREGAIYRLRGSASIETAEMLIEADEIDFNEELNLAEARGRVHLLSFREGEEIWAARAEYRFNEQSGAFYEVRGSAPAKIDPRPGILTTGQPFLFQGDWAEKINDRYMLYRGTLTNCTYPDPWWTLSSPQFDIIPGDRAIANQATFRMRRVPIFYAPKFYKSLSDSTRKSGFLTPNIGTSNRRGFMVGMAYYWAINRSYDLLYRPQYFTQRGLAHNVDFRAKPTQNSDFNFILYGIDDKGLKLPDGRREDQGGYLMSVNGRIQWGRGFYSRAVVNHLSNFLFRQSFTETFNEAVFSEVNSIFFTAKDWSTYHLNIVFTQQVNFQDTTPGNQIEIRKLPRVEFLSRDRELSRRALPLWISWNSSFGLVRRTQPLFQTRRFVERLDFEPRLMTAVRWKDVHITPYASFRETYYGSSFDNGTVTGANYNRLSREVGAEMVLPSLSRIFDAPRWTGARQWKHSIEPRILFRRVSGVTDFERAVRFDEMEIVANTTEFDITVANRLWAKTRAGEVRDYLTWELSQRRYLDPDFGGALQPGQRNVFLSTAQMTAYTFLNERRHYSPVVSVLRAQPRPAFGLEWRTDYDPLRGKLINGSASADARFNNYFFSVGHNKVSCIPLVGEGGPADPCRGTPAPGTVLSPPSNQIRGMVGLGQENRRGWNGGFFALYDYRLGILQFANTQVTYNTNCCAYSFQYRRLNFGTRDENQFRVAFVIANIGSFGTLRRQERLF